MAARYYRVREVAEMLALSEQQIYRLFAKGVLPGIRLGGSVRISGPGLEAYLARITTGLATDQDATSQSVTLAEVAKAASPRSPAAAVGGGAFQHLPRE